MQCLATIDDHGIGLACEDPKKLVLEYENLIKKLRNGKGVLTPSRFKRAMALTDDTFNNTNPQDAQEFLSSLLTLLKEKRAGGGVEERAVGQMRSTMRCASCSFMSESDEEFNMLSLPIGKQRNQLLNDCLECYLGDEEIVVEEGWRCEECSTVRSGKKNFDVVKSPEMLIIHMKRFKFTDGRIEKINAEIGIGQQIHLAGVQYSLSGIVKHEGTRESGHYVAVIRTGTGWLEVNDEKVSATVLGDLHWCSKAYLLFYEASPQKSYSVSDTSIRRGPATSESRN